MAALIKIPGARWLLAAVAAFCMMGAAPQDALVSGSTGASASTDLHYKIYRKGKAIGDHFVSFEQRGASADISIEFAIRVKFLGITAFQMDHKATENWALEPLTLQSLSATTDRSSGTFHVKVDSEDSGYMIDVNGEETPAPAEFVPTSFTIASHLFSETDRDVTLLDTLSGILRPSRIEFKELLPSEDFQNAVGSVRYYEIVRLDTGAVSHRIWYDDTDAFLQVGLSTKDGHYVEYRRQA